MSSLASVDTEKTAAYERNLMQLYCHGDQRAFAELHARMAPLIRRFLCRLGADDATSDDLTQQTFMKVVTSRHQYVPDGSPRRWFYTIARHAFIDEARRRRQISRVQDDFAIATLTLTHTERANDSSLVPVVLEAIAALPSAQREAIRMTKLVGLSLIEVAASQGTSVGALKLRVHRGCRRLREELGPLLAHAS